MNTVFLDIDTQLDFVLPTGALYVRGAERLLPAFAKLNRYAVEHGIPLISTTDAHTEDDPEFRAWPHHCIKGTLGQHKPAALVHGSPLVVSTRPQSVAVAGARQIIVEKQVLRASGNPNLPAILEQLRPDRFVVYGVATEYCVGLAALDLLETGKPVEIVEDAVEGIARADIDALLSRFTARGGRLANVAQVCA